MLPMVAQLTETIFFKEMSVLCPYLKSYVFWVVFLQNTHEQNFLNFFSASIVVMICYEYS